MDEITEKGKEKRIREWWVDVYRMGSGYFL
jgi:hypothetical protein